MAQKLVSIRQPQPGLRERVVDCFAQAREAAEQADELKWRNPDSTLAHSSAEKFLESIPSRVIRDYMIEHDLQIFLSAWGRIPPQGFVQRHLRGGQGKIPTLLRVLREAAAQPTSRDKHWFLLEQAVEMNRRTGAASSEVQPDLQSTQERQDRQDIQGLREFWGVLDALKEDDTIQAAAYAAIMSEQGSEGEVFPFHEHVMGDRLTNARAHPIKWYRVECAKWMTWFNLRPPLTAFKDDPRSATTHWTLSNYKAPDGEYNPDVAADWVRLDELNKRLKADEAGMKRVYQSRRAPARELVSSHDKLRTDLQEYLECLKSLDRVSGFDEFLRQQITNAEQDGHREALESFRECKVDIPVGVRMTEANILYATNMIRLLSAEGGSPDSRSYQVARALEEVESVKVVSPHDAEEFYREQEATFRTLDRLMNADYVVPYAGLLKASHGSRIALCSDHFLAALEAAPDAGKLIAVCANPHMRDFMLAGDVLPQLGDFVSRPHVLEGLHRLTDLSFKVDGRTESAPEVLVDNHPTLGELAEAAVRVSQLPHVDAGEVKKILLRQERQAPKHEPKRAPKPQGEPHPPLQRREAARALRKARDTLARAGNTETAALIQQLAEARVPDRTTEADAVKIITALEADASVRQMRRREAALRQVFESRQPPEASADAVVKQALELLDADPNIEQTLLNLTRRVDVNAASILHEFRGDAETLSRARVLIEGRGELAGDVLRILADGKPDGVRLLHQAVKDGKRMKELRPLIEWVDASSNEELTDLKSYTELVE